nr:hypothetical protein CFP56_00392 [Quercus suber]
MAKVILLAGAPKFESLRWGEDSLVQHFQPSVRRFLGESNSPLTFSSPSILSPFVAPKWRIVPCHPSVDANVPPLHHDSPSRSHSNADTHLDFLEHSLAVLDAKESTIISFDTTEDTTTTTTSFATTASSPSPAPAHDPLPVPTAPFIVPSLTNLDRLPTASHLTSLHPQTLTINLLAAVIQASPLRTVRLRRQHNTAKLILELLLGDDTRSNFSVTFWFPCPTETAGGSPTTRPAANKEMQHLRTEALALRPGDVVLMQNIALTQWRGVVHGCSLQWRAARSSSKVTRLVEDRGLDVLLPAAACGKLNRVRRWRDDFVGYGHRINEKESRDDDATVRDELPVDETQIARS